VMLMLCGIKHSHCIYAGSWLMLMPVICHTAG